MTSGANNATVVAVTVNWNGLNDTIECVQSLLAQTHHLAEIVVVDNASDSDDADRIVDLFGPLVSLVRNSSNLGCAGGYNSGIHSVATHLSPDYILAVNNDVVADLDMVAELVKVAQSDRTIGVVGPKILYHDLNGRHDVIWSAGGVINRWGLKYHTQRGDGKVDGREFNTACDVDWTSGAAILLTPAALKDGGQFNTWYFIGHEDIELCLKARAFGHRVVYTPRARAWHKVGASAKKVGITYADPAAYFYLIKHTSPMYVYLYHLALFPALIARWGVLYLAKSRDRAQLRRFFADMRRFVSRAKPA